MAAARRSHRLGKARGNFLRAAVTLRSAHADRGQGSEEHQRCHRKEQECERARCWEEREMISVFPDHFTVSRLSFPTLRCQIDIENLI